MAAGRPVGTGVPIPGRHGPALIAHGAGNTAARARAAITEVADCIEVDLWVHDDRFEARHERAIYPLPVWFEKWYLRLAPRRPFGLAELLREAGSEVGILLDLKNGGADAARLIRRALDEAGPSVRVAASSQLWHTLRQVNLMCPEIDLFYSIDVQAKFDLFRSVAERDFQPAGVSCRHTLLTQAMVSDLHAGGLKVVAWTVDDLDRAAELAAWGVDGITTHRVAGIRARLGIER